ncbi:MAG: TolC family protein [Pedobacter sp.]|jgi:outer membrane protein|uniref:TolC family protein n=1 Tax=Pedobacter sp. TaxID=1411316 RepID=UPI00356A077E
MKQVANFSFLTKLTFILSFVITGFSQKSFAQEVITIQQAVDKTLTNNLQVKQANFSESLSDINLKQSKYALLPTLGANLSQDMRSGRNNQGASGVYENTQNYSLNGGASSNVDLFSGLTKMNQIKQNKVLLEASKTNTSKIKNDLILSVITSYLQILYNKDFLKAANDQLIVAKQQLNQQQQLLDVGNKTLADLSQAKSQVATAELNATNAENALSISYLTLAQLMDIPSSTVYEVQAPVIDNINTPNGKYNAEEIYANASAMFPDIKLASLNTEAAKIAVKIAKGSLLPTLSFNASYGTGYFYNYNFNPQYPNASFSNQLNNNISKGVGMSLSIPIFNGLQIKSNYRRAKINLMQTETDEQLAKNNLNKVIYQAVADLKAAEGRYASTTNAFTAQKDAYYVIEQRYNVGLVNSLDYSTALTNKNKAEIDMIQAKYDLIFRAKVIDYYLGKQITF